MSRLSFFAFILAVLISHSYAQTPIIQRTGEPPSQSMESFKNNPANKIYSTVDKRPQFVGDANGFVGFVENNFSYAAVNKDFLGQMTIKVAMVVERDGSLTEIVVLGNVEPTLKTEALRVMRSSPKWRPGVKGGKVVRTADTVSIHLAVQRTY